MQHNSPGIFPYESYYAHFSLSYIKQKHNFSYIDEKKQKFATEMKLERIIKIPFIWKKFLK